MPIAQLPGDLQMYYEDDDFTDPWSQVETVILHHGNAKNARFQTRSLAELLPKGRLVEVPGASGYVQHSAPTQCVAIWRDFVKTVM